MAVFSVVAPELNESSVRLIEALVDQPGATTAELAVVLDRSEAATYRAMHELIVRGIVSKTSARHALNPASEIARFEASLVRAARANKVSREEAIYRALLAYSEPHRVDSDDAVFWADSWASIPFDVETSAA